MTSRAIHRFCPATTLLGLVFTVGGPNAMAQDRTTALQNNGSECVNLTNSFTIYRSELGLNNYSSSNIVVECPLIDASDDSYPSFLPVRHVEVHYRGTAPTCFMEARDNSGAVVMSPTFTATTSSSSGLPVVKLNASWKVGTSTPTAAFILRCTLPADTWIVGSTAVRDHHRIEGGI